MIVPPDTEHPADDAVRDRLRRRARRLVEALPRTADELRGRLSEKPWARPHGDLVEQVVAECAEKGLLGGGGHAKALRDRLFNYAVSLLAHSARTERELRRRLARPVWSTSVLVDDVVGALERYGYVDDEGYARRFAERRAAGGRSGPRLLRLELRAKGIGDRELIEDAVRDAFERIPESEAIDMLIEKRSRSKPIVTQDDMRRLRDFLLRRGFEPETVYERLRALRSGLDDDQS